MLMFQLTPYIFLLIWLLPVIFVAASSRVQGSEKVGWVMATFFLTWWAFLAFMIVTTLRNNNRPSRM